MDITRFPRKKPIHTSILQKNSGVRPPGCSKSVIVLSLILGNYPDVYVIVALLLLNAVLGFFQEQRASGAVDALKQKLRVNARTLRDGKWQMIPARELYPVILSE